MKKLLWVVAPTGIYCLYLLFALVVWILGVIAAMIPFVATTFASSFLLLIFFSPLAFVICYGCLLFRYIEKHENGYSGKAFLLIIGFLLPLIVTIIIDYPYRGGPAANFTTTLMAYLYTGPGIVITIIVIVALKVKEKRFQRKGREKADAGQNNGEDRK